ncbi:hypothetical protein BGZ94_006069, partial [Podila epigama]
MDGTAGDGGIELESEIEDVTLSGGKATVEGMEGADNEEFNILDLLLMKAAGMALIKHLYALTLNGKISARGPKTKKAASKAVKAIAQRTYARLLQIAPEFQPTNTDNIAMGRPIIAAAKLLIVNLRTHFRKVPFTIGDKMLKHGWDKKSLPKGSLKDDESLESTEDAEEDQDNSDLAEDMDLEDADGEEVEVEDEDPSTSFPPGYIHHWWQQAMRLPSLARPAFCLRRPFKNCFFMLDERALPDILWSGSKKFPNPAQTSAEKIMTAKEARQLVNEDFGRLIKILFYGDREKIRDSPSVWQTTYGKRTTTMAELSDASED